ncbi:MAG: HesA/MoeB/ThiF family protein [Bowdeniella nasicola]|nr:HesA/MoeB/ThiF family protein [Bowdeniella nasicola]
MPLTVPLSAPLSPLSARQQARYHRTCLVPGIGEEGQRRLLAAKVLVVGAGGLGSPVLLYLAAAGIGQLTIADADVVESSNLQRQIIHTTTSVGTAKTASAAARIRGLNPDVSVSEHGWLTGENIDALVSEHDLVVECSDTFDTKFLVADAAARLGIPLVWGSIVAMTFQVGAFWSHAPAPYPATGLRDLYPDAPPAGTTPSSFDVGVLGAVCGQAGGVMASEVVKLITGAGEPLLGRIVIADAAAGRWNTVQYAPATKRVAAARQAAAQRLADPHHQPAMPDDDLLEDSGKGKHD